MVYRNMIAYNMCRTQLRYGMVPLPEAGYGILWVKWFHNNNYYLLCCRCFYILIYLCWNLHEDFIQADRVHLKKICWWFHVKRGMRYLLTTVCKPVRCFLFVLCVFLVRIVCICNLCVRRHEFQISCKDDMVIGLSVYSLSTSRNIKEWYSCIRLCCIMYLTFVPVCFVFLLHILFILFSSIL